MTSKLTADRQQEIREEGKATFQGGTSSNPYNEGTHAYDLFLDGWLEAKRDHYYSNEGTLTISKAYTAGKAAFNADKEVSANPYKALFAQAWEDGWYTAMQEDALKDIL